VDVKYPTRVFWGDTHLHTSQSFDAVMFGTRLGPEDAYRFGRGEEVISSTGQCVQLSRPLDFLVIADHAESYGAMSAVLAGDPQLMGDPNLKRWHDLMNQGPEGGMKVFVEVGTLISWQRQASSGTAKRSKDRPVALGEEHGDGREI
jgi:hypothetical protein